MGVRNQVGIGLSYRPAGLCSLATQFRTRFLESIPRPIETLCRHSDPAGAGHEEAAERPHVLPGQGGGLHHGPHPHPHQGHPPLPHRASLSYCESLFYSHTVQCNV
jgi:hypothetical protein